MTKRCAWACVSFGMALMLVGCGSTPKDRFYTLSSAPTSDPAAATAGYSVAVGPITVPEAVDRPQLVVRVAANRVEISESHRWAEPLKSEIPRVLAQTLASELGATRIAPYGQSASLDADFRVALDVQGFESTLGEGVAIEVLWSVRRAKGGEVRASRSLIREPAPAGDYEGLAAAHGRALARIGREIAAVIRAMQ